MAIESVSYPFKTPCYGVRRQTRRHLWDISTDGNEPMLEEVVEEIFGSTETVMMNHGASFGLRRSALYCNMVNVDTPENLLAHDFAKQIGKTAIDGLWIAGFSTVNEKLSTENDESLAIATKKLYDHYQIDGGAHMVIVECDRSVEIETRDRIAELYETIASLNVPAARITQFN